MVNGDRVKETSTTTGTGDLTLLGAVSQFQAFSAVCANLDLVPYAIVGQTGTEWEVGTGTWNTGNTLTRTTVLTSSNAGAAVNLSAGTKDVFCAMPAMQGALAFRQRIQNAALTLLPSTSSVVVIDDYELTSGTVLELGVNSIFQIIT